MRIAILTLPLRLNYGGILQAYALQTVLTRMGHDVKVVYNSPYCNDSLFIQVYRALRHIVGKYILHRYKGPIFDKKAYNDNYKAISANVQPFIDKYIHKYVSEKGMKINKESDFDAIIVGSDQVWRPCYAGNIERYFLDFAKNWDVKKIAYAASFGVDNWEFSKKQTNHCRLLFGLFNGVSVREKSGIGLCKKYFGWEPQIVLDPTLLLDVFDYNSISVGHFDIIQKNSLFSYILDGSSEKQGMSKFIAKKLNCRINSLCVYSQDDKGVIPSLEDWLSSFQNSRFVFTDSFHGCVFSIIYNKPFLVFLNEERGKARIDSLLGLFGLQDRIIDSVNHIDDLLSSTIDWEAVNEKLKKMQGVSLLFFKAYLS
jgi:hypothetical protein